MCSCLRRFLRVVLDDAEAARLTALVKAHAGVQNLAKLFKCFAQLVAIHAVRQVADVDGEGLLSGGRR